MLRKLVMSGLTALGLAVPLSLTASAQAHPPVSQFRTEFEVLYRQHHGHYSHHHQHVRWQVYGAYCSQFEADRAALRLERLGYEARVELRPTAVGVVGFWR